MTTQIRERTSQLASAGSYNGGIVRDVATLATSDATATKIYGIPVALLESVAFRVLIVGMKTDATASYASTVVGGARRQAAGNVTSAGSATIVTIEDSAGSPVATVNANTSTQEMEIKIAGVAAENWRFEACVEYIKLV